MLPLILPESAAPFTSRSDSIIILGSKVDPWLTDTLKQIRRTKQPLNSVPQHKKLLTEILSSSSAIWTLCSLHLPNAPDIDLPRFPFPLADALFNYELIHVEAYVIHVDMVLHNEIVFKLRKETIESLIKHHKEIFLVNAATMAFEWSGKEFSIKNLHEEFVQAVNKFTYRTHVRILEELHDDGTGALTCDGSQEVQSAILHLFLPLICPSPTISSSSTIKWWPSAQADSSEPPFLTACHSLPSESSSGTELHPRTISTNVLHAEVYSLLSGLLSSNTFEGNI